MNEKSPSKEKEDGAVEIHDGKIEARETNPGIDLMGNTKQHKACGSKEVTKKRKHDGTIIVLDGKAEATEPKQLDLIDNEKHQRVSIDNDNAKTEHAKPEPEHQPDLKKMMIMRT